MRITLVGYAASGKTTLFEMLTGTAAEPGSAHTGQLAMAKLDDPRVDRLVALYGSKKITPAALQLQDTPGLKRGAGRDNARRLAAWREADALALVVDAFSGGDPAADLAEFEDDLVLADLEVLAGALDRLRAAGKKPRPDRDEQLALVAVLEPLEQALGDGTPLHAMQLSDEQRAAVRSYGLLTQKPRIVLFNVDEDSAASQIAPPVSAPVRTESACFKFERELMDLEPDEQALFLSELRLDCPARNRILAALLETSGQTVFFTAGPKEVRAWLVPNGANAVTAAGAIHTDLARGFIRVEVIAADALIEAGSERDAKAAGLFHVEGRDYIVQNGDVLLVRFSV